MVRARDGPDRAVPGRNGRRLSSNAGTYDYNGVKNAIYQRITGYKCEISRCKNNEDFPITIYFGLFVFRPFFVIAFLVCFFCGIGLISSSPSFG
jgi:hypothetical protein